MRAVVQRVRRAAVAIDGDVVGTIGRGLLVLVGIAVGDDEADVATLADKILGLRIFSDEADRMNLAVADAGGAILVVSQFTLLASVRKGRRPSFTAAADPDRADELIDALVERIHRAGIAVATGRFGARMAVELVNDGPVTIVIDVDHGRVR